MSYANVWAQVWTIHGSKITAGFPNPFPKDSQFWLEPVKVDGSVAFFYFRFNPGSFDPGFTNMRLYPVGVRAMVMDPLDPWKEGDDDLAETYMGRADDKKKEGRSDPLALRLEGTFTTTANGPAVTEVARLYFFPAGEKDGRDWFAWDIIPPVPVKVQDGTAHGDGRK